MCPCAVRGLAIVPAVLFGAAAVALFVDAAASADVVATPAPVAVAAPAPEALTATTTTRDWNETSGTGVRRR